MTKLRDVTCHMGSQCQLLPDTRERAPPNRIPHACTRFTYLGGIDGRVDLVTSQSSRAASPPEQTASDLTNRRCLMRESRYSFTVQRRVEG